MVLYVAGRTTKIGQEIAIRAVRLLNECELLHQVVVRRLFCSFAAFRMVMPISLLILVVYSTVPVGLDIGILTMSLGYRVFFVHGTDVRRISHKQHNSLYSKSAEALTSYRGQTVVSVLVFYELVARRPDCIVRMDTQKIRFDENGFLDCAYEDEGLKLAASKMDGLLSGIVNSKETARSDVSGQANGSIVDAIKRFDERRWNQRHPELSGPMVKKILTGVFGSA